MKGHIIQPSESEPSSIAELIASKENNIRRLKPIASTADENQSTIDEWSVTGIKKSKFSQKKQILPSYFIFISLFKLHAHNLVFSQRCPDGTRPFLFPDTSIPIKCSRNSRCPHGFVCTHSICCRHTEPIQQTQPIPAFTIVSRSGNNGNKLLPAITTWKVLISNV